MEDLISELITLGHALASTGHVRGTGGNLSVRTNERVWITARGASLGALTPADCVPIALTADTSAAPAVSAHTRAPSTEWRMHLAAYHARAEAHWVLHAHSPHAIALGLCGTRFVPLTPDHYLYLGDEVPLVPYHLPGSAELAEAVARALATPAVAVLLQNHGALVTGADATRARLRLETLEDGAQIALLARSAGGDHSGLPIPARRALDELTGGRYRVA